MVTDEGMARWLFPFFVSGLSRNRAGFFPDEMR